MRYLFFIALIASTLTAHGVSIKGKAPGYEGKTAQLFHYHDFISYSLEELGKTVVDDSGHFQFDWKSNGTDLYILRINHINAYFYADSTAAYTVTFPPLPKDKAYSIANVSTVELLFENMDVVEDINARISDFNTCYEQFFIDHYTEIAARQFGSRLDTLKKDVDDYFAPRSDDPWFDAFAKYTIGQTEQLLVGQGAGKQSRKRMYADYLEGQPVLYNNIEYMKFVQDFYREYIPTYVMYNGNKVIDYIINSLGSYVMLDSALQRDIYLREPQLRELVAINAMSEIYHNKKFDKPMVRNILDSISTKGKYPENRAIAGAVLRELTKMEPGSPAPDFALQAADGSTVKLSDLEGKYVYIDFWATWCKPCIAEMTVMKDLYKKYNKDITFVSISIDENPEDMQAFMENHPDLDWTFLHFGGDTDLMQQYQVRALPMYYLIGPDGTFYQSPALSPSPNGTNITVDKVFHEIYVKLHPTKGHNVGSRQNN